MTVKNAAVLFLALTPLLSACGSGGEEGGLTAEESRKLNEAEALLDESVEDVPPER